MPRCWSICPRLSLVLLLAALLTACGALPPAAVTPAPATSLPTAVAGDTYGPIVVTSGPAGQTRGPRPTPPPVLPPGAAVPVLKYRVLDAFPDLFYCDPDVYPVARGDEADLARERFPVLQADAAEFEAILERLGLGGLTTWTDDQKLLIYREHKRLAAVSFELAGDRYRFRLQTATSEGEGFAVTGLIDGSGTITAVEREPAVVSCPRCLAAGTWIDTPRGPAPVEELRAGAVVWTADAAGTRRPAAVVAAVRVPAPAGHELVHIALSDGRELWASPGHPTAAGRPLGRLQVGDLLDGAVVVHLERGPCEAGATYDLLPSGGTGLYWANGILVRSTLAP